MEFDKNKILTCVTANQAKVGQKGWFGNTLELLKEQVKCSNPSELIRVLGEDCNLRFKKETYSHWALFYPAPKPTYAERQTEWVMENQIEIGTKVRIARDFTPNEDGSTCIFGTDDRAKKHIVGKIGKVDRLFDDCVVVNMSSGRWTCPFTALEVIKEPTYRPYNNDELNDLVGEILTNKQSGRRKLVTGKPTASEGVNLDGSYINAKDLLFSFYRNGNEPCGVREEA